jgi:hypothetical protein
VDSTDQIKAAVWWVIACMAIHNFVIDVEQLEDNFDVDEFYKAGLKIIEEKRAEEASDDTAEGDDAEVSAARDLELLHGQLK